MIAFAAASFGGLMRSLGAIGIVTAVVLAVALSSAAQAWIITATGTIYGQSGDANETGLFGLPGASLVGDSYTATISTNPALNTYHTSLTPSLHETYGGAGIGGCCGAPYTITMTVNGVTFTQTETKPLVNRSYLLDPLTMNDSPTPQDQVYQEVLSPGCLIAYGPCTNTYILAYSITTPFIPTLDFNQSIDFSAGLDPASNTYFSFRQGPTAPGSVQEYTKFYGTISTLSVNSVPEASTFALFGFGLLGLGALRRRKAKA